MVLLLTRQPLIAGKLRKYGPYAGSAFLGTIAIGGLVYGGVKYFNPKKSDIPSNPVNTSLETPSNSTTAFEEVLEDVTLAPKKSSSVLWIALAVVFLLLLVCGIAYYVMLRNQKSDESTDLLQRQTTAIATAGAKQKE